MATKKQQRRREKERRHEYEVVYVDEDGNEVEPPPEASDAPAKPAKTEKGKQPAKAQARGGGRRPLREIKPPSWKRVIRRALLFAPLLYVALSIGKHPPAIPVRLLISIGYTALFVPTFYWIDRLAYRRYQRMSGDGVSAKK